MFILMKNIFIVPAMLQDRHAKNFINELKIIQHKHV